jgi:hypothetical protein
LMVDPPSIAAAIYGVTGGLERKSSVGATLLYGVERKRKSETWPAVVQISWLRIFARDVFSSQIANSKMG